MNTEDHYPSRAHSKALDPFQRNPQIGILRNTWRWLVGEPDRAKQEIHAATSHGAFIMALARVFSAPLMVFFSIGALITLGKNAIIQSFALWQSNRALDWINLAGLLVTVAFVFAMDLAMLVAATHLRDGRARGVRVRDQWGHALVVVGVGGLEAWTLFRMMKGLESPTTLSAEAFILARAALAPIMAIYLATTGPRAPTRQDMEQLLKVKVGRALLTYMGQSVPTGTGRLPDLFELLSLLDDTPPASQRRHSQVIRVFERLTSSRDVRDDEQPQGHSADVEVPSEDPNLVFPVETARAFREEHCERESPARGTSVHDIGDDDAIAGSTEARHLDLSHAVQLSSVRDQGAQAGDETVRWSSRAQEQRAFLEELGLEPVQTPPNRKGAFVQATHLDRLTAGKMTGDAARQFIKRLGDGLQVGKAYVAPFNQVLDDLYERNALADDVRQWWESHRDYGQRRGSIMPDTNEAHTT